MNTTPAAITDSIRLELETLWAAHRAVGLEGYMCLYSLPHQHTWRAAEEGRQFWFGVEDTNRAIEAILSLYNGGELPNTTLLLNPIVHALNEDQRFVPLGSGVFWATGFTLGIAELSPEQHKRLNDLGLSSNFYKRGDNPKAGQKMLGFSHKILAAEPDGITVVGCREVYELSNIESAPYAPYYLLSGLNYLCTHGIFQHENFASMLEGAPDSLDSYVSSRQVDVQNVIDANTCWNAYDRHHSLYTRFGQNPADIRHNSRFYDLCARDLELFDKTGPMRKGSDESFYFVVPGLIPRGAVTLIAASGGTGKSSIAHKLCVEAAIDREPGEELPLWLGQKVNAEACKGMCIYFSGEDGPAIINARSELFDPEGRAQRLQFHRTEHIDKEISFAKYLRTLMKMPDVSILVVDPARKYLPGDENDAAAVSEFFEAIEEFAMQKNCAVLVVHHLEKGAHPRNAREVLDALRGSQVFIDRPRVILGMARDEKYVVVGLAKCNIPPSLGMVLEERVFARNPKTLDLLWLKGEQGIRQNELSEDEIRQITDDKN